MASIATSSTKNTLRRTSHEERNDRSAPLLDTGVVHAYEIRYNMYCWTLSALPLIHTFVPTLTKSPVHACV